MTATPAAAARVRRVAPRVTDATRDARRLLRLEGLAMLVAATVAYGQSGSGWGLFAAAFLLPDLTMLGYLAGPRAGAAAYNAGHSYLGPALLLGLAGTLGGPGVVPLALIWFAHIGFDRLLGYGLKHTSGFRDTHLGRIGRADPW